MNATNETRTPQRSKASKRNNNDNRTKKVYVKKGTTTTTPASRNNNKYNSTTTQAKDQMPKMQQSKKRVNTRSVTTTHRRRWKPALFAGVPTSEHAVFGVAEVFQLILSWCCDVETLSALGQVSRHFRCHVQPMWELLLVEAVGGRSALLGLKIENENAHAVYLGYLAAKESRKRRGHIFHVAHLPRIGLFGYYCCYSCHRCWESGHAYVGETQQCIKCNKALYPYSFRPKKNEEGASLKPHQTSKCSACAKGFCSYYAYDPLASKDNNNNNVPQRPVYIIGNLYKPNK